MDDAQFLEHAKCITDTFSDYLGMMAALPPHTDGRVTNYPTGMGMIRACRAAYLDIQKRNVLVVSDDGKGDISRILDRPENPTLAVLYKADADHCITGINVALHPTRWLDRAKRDPARLCGSLAGMTGQLALARLLRKERVPLKEGALDALTLWSEVYEVRFYYDLLEAGMPLPTDPHVQALLNNYPKATVAYPASTAPIQE